MESNDECTEDRTKLSMLGRPMEGSRTGGTILNSEPEPGGLGGANGDHRRMPRTLYEGKDRILPNHTATWGS